MNHGSNLKPQTELSCAYLPATIQAALTNAITIGRPTMGPGAYGHFLSCKAINFQVKYCKKISSRKTIAILVPISTFKDATYQVALAGIETIPILI